MSESTEKVTATEIMEARQFRLDMERAIQKVLQPLVDTCVNILLKQSNPPLQLLPTGEIKPLVVATPEVCLNCYGSGYVKRDMPSPTDEDRYITTICPNCQGTGLRL